MRMLPLLLALLGVLAGLVGCGPTLVLPGGALEGRAQPAPSDWSFTDEIGTVQLETRPGDPYSVNIGCASVGGRLYVSAGDYESRWVRHMQADPRVRLRIDDTVYELRATRVEDAAEIAAFGKAWTAKQSFGRDPTKLDELFLYRLEPR